MARIMFPHIVDMSYAASAPMGFYAQEVDRFAYYDHITNVADTSFPGCARGVQATLVDVELLILASTKDDLEASAVGICSRTIPDYILTDDDPNTRMVEELMMVVGYTFANDNMASYPPSYDTRLYQACATFASTQLTSTEKVKKFLVNRLSQGTYEASDTTTSLPTKIRVSSCWNMTSQLPSGPKATISSGDWSGVGNGDSGESWDFQTCTLLVEAIGFGDNSMFVPRDWSLQWLQRHCQERFGVVPRPYELVNQWKFNSLVETNVTRILFTNGLRDGWSVGGVQKNLSDSLIALNFENGAHHSDLSHSGPTSNDTDDIKAGHKSIAYILQKWLYEVRQEGNQKKMIS
jgi:hypothetical protein